MVYLYSGTPGSGKSLDVAGEIISWLKSGRNVIGNMYLNRDMIAKYKGQYIFVETYLMKPSEFISYAKKYLKKGKESQCLIVIDECHRIFNARYFNEKGRREWCEFFPIHRQFGFDIYLVSQWDRQIDRQIRAMIEFEIKHRKGNNMGRVGFVLSLFVGTFFVRVEKWYGENQRLGSSFFRYHRRLGRLYDGFMAFDEDGKDKLNELFPLIAPVSSSSGSVVGSGGQGVPTTDSGTTTTADGYRVDQYGFLADPSYILDNSNNSHSSTENQKGENENVDL